MARHRNVRNLDLDDELLDDLEYGHSYDEHEGVPSSPTQQQFLYQRKRVTSTSGVFGVHELSDFVPVKEDGEEGQEDDYDFDVDDPHADMFDMDDVRAYRPSNSNPPMNKQNQTKNKAPVKNGQQKFASQTKPAADASKVNVAALRVSDEPDMIVSATSSNAAQVKPSPSIEVTRSSNRKNVNGKPTAVSPPVVSQLKAEAAKRSASSSRSPVRRPATPGAGSGLKARTRTRPAGVKPLINLVVVGHVDAGKSTLMGHVLYQLGNVNKRAMQKYQHDSQKSGKASFAYAWVLDETEEERSRGVTMDIGKTNFETDNRRVTLLDAPGHKDFIPNMITGAAQADAAILVVNATRGEFETGFDLGGQTREHAMLLRSLGVSQLVIVVNKLDTVDWSKSRFDEITIKVRQFLAKQAGWPQAQNVPSVPVSGLNGVNLTHSPTADHPLSQWYSGPTLLALIDLLTPPERLDAQPLRLTVSDVFKSASSSVSLAGMVETGSVEIGDRVLLQPHALACVVRALRGDGPGTTDSSDDLLQCSSSNEQVCYAGDSCVLTLTGANFESVTVAAGCVVCHPDVEPLEPLPRFKCKLVVFDVLVPITRGYTCELHAHNLCEPVAVKKLCAKLSKSTGAVEKEKPRCLPKHTSGVVDIVTASGLPVCVEAYSRCKQLGRVTLRAAGKTIAAGIVVAQT